MRKIDSTIVKEAEIYVTELLDNELSKDCLFHTKKHTLDVVHNAEIIGEYSMLSNDSINLLRISALFHDTGYIKSYENHEVESAAYASIFLRSKNVHDSDINKVVESILATKMPQQPKDDISRILCDADLMNMTFDDYFEQIDLMRQEWEKTGKAKLNKHQAYITSLEFFRSHNYHSEYGKKVLQPMKEKTESLIKLEISLINQPGI
jgi:predicted metal-dependent HD superfamily phosphohydrolase